MENNISHKNKMVARWLLAGVLMILIQILLGGITRLTGSGLSITEWKPIMGALPPASEAEWLTAFGQYKQIAQFKYLNNHFTIEDFKFIFFWEWFHRLWARLLGVVFLTGFVFFVIKKYFQKEMINPLIILFLLGALQGLIGWIMVASGLNDENLYVSHYRLAIHFIAALVLLCYTFWFALHLLVPQQQRADNPALRQFSYGIVVVLLLQLIYGAFMSGLKAAPAAATWPDVNGALFPSFMQPGVSWIKNITANVIGVHVIHRSLAYLLVLLTGWWYLKTRNANQPLLRKTRWLPLFFIVLQLLLGIATVLHGTQIVPGRFGRYEWLAQIHQMIAIAYLLSMIWMIYIIRAPRKAA